MGLCMKRRAWLGLAVAIAFAPAAAFAQDGLVIFAAASLKNALDEIATGWKDSGKPAAKISSAAKEMQKSAKIADVRNAFGKLSEALVAYLDAQKRKPGAGLKVAVCPMVDKPWIQKDGPIQNPYYGSEMLGCGSFKK